MTQPDRVRPEDARLAGAGLAPARRLDPRVAFAALVAGIIGWIGLGVLAAMLLAREPAAAGFDLDLILGAADRVRGGLSPYDPAALSALGLEAVDLFYSYPPIIAQAVSLLPAMSLGTALAGVWVVAVAAWTGTAGLLAGGSGRARWLIALASVAVLPLVMPMAIALLFGNLDALFLAGYGIVLAGVLRGERRPVLTLAAGIGLGLMALTKLYPAALALWLIVLGIRQARMGRQVTAAPVLLAAAGTVIAMVAVSLIGWGLAPWEEYVAVLRSASEIDVLVRPNVGPAAIVAGWLGGSEATARTLQLAVVGLAATTLGWAGWSCRDSVVAASIAATASFVVLPLTWLHYPAALIPFGLAAALRSWPGRSLRITAALLLAAALIAAVAVVVPAVVWLAVGVLVTAAWRSGRA